MTNLAHRQQKIQEKRKKTPWREFVMEICSRRPLMFYKRNQGISKYPNVQTRNVEIMSHQQYENQYTDGMGGGQEMNDDHFFAQYQKLFYTVPHVALQFYGLKNENSERGDAIRNGAKNTYLSVSVGDNAENVLYTFKAETNVRNVVNSVNVTSGSDIVFASKTVRKSYKIFYSQHIYDSTDIWFSSNLVGCSQCFGCNDLQNQSYCIFDKQYTPKEYVDIVVKLIADKQAFPSYGKYIQKAGIRLSEGCSGEALFNCDNVNDSYEVSNVGDGRNVLYTDGGENTTHCYDCMDVAADATHHLYGVYGQAFGEHIYNTVYTTDSSYIFYCYFMQNCTYCLGCIGLKNKSYCILNKQYTKEDRYEKVDEIFAQMEQEGTLGQFFPGWMNPFYFNDTAAYLIDQSFNKEEVEAKGYLRRDEPIKVDIPEGMEVVKTSELGTYEGFDNEGNRTINADILKKVIQDEQGNVYRIIPMEYKFLVKHGLPLPRKHWLERMKENFRIN